MLMILKLAQNENNLRIIIESITVFSHILLKSKTAKKKQLKLILQCIPFQFNSFILFLFLYNKPFIQYIFIIII